ncbi:MAG: response regulator [Candidatus Marithrix sp.]|nr:response regulator [Candidatus Marithrix sp.]
MINKILIVDDEPNNLDILRDCLHKAGFKVPVANDGETALELVEHINPDLILLDIMMPGIDGFETCRRLKKNKLTKDIPIIFISAKTDVVDKVEGLNMSAVDYINKPFQPEEVVARVDKHLTINNLRKQLEMQNTVLRENEEQLHKFSRAIEQSANIVVITDIEGNIEFVNPSFIQTTGYSYKETIGQNPRILNAGKQSQSFYQELWSTITNGHVWRGEMLNKRKDGECYWEFVTISPLKDATGKITHYVAIKENINQRKEYEEKLRQALKSAEQAKKEADFANRAKSVFLANMSHELRTPLNGILGFTQILQLDSSITAQQQDGLNVIEQSGNHLLALINDVLDLAKVESGKIELHQTDFNLLPLLNNVSEIIKIKIESENIDFNLKLAEDLPNEIHGDERRLQQILLNLLGNAIKFTDKGSVTLEVKSELLPAPPIKNIKTEELNPLFSKEREKVVISFQVEDTGVGISPENIKTIFQPFEQVGEKERQVKGTGLGLAISKNLVELMGGKLCVNSQINIGTQFWFEIVLPIVEHYVTEISTQQKIIGVKGEPPKILVVDNNLDNQAVIVSLLSPLGFKVNVANNGDEGLKMAQQWQPDMIITDLVMPKMDGSELIRQLRKSPQLQDIIIIISSANVYDINSNLGGNNFLPKPIQVTVLFAQLQQYLNLDWIYEDKVKKPENNLASMAFPPNTELKKLYELSLNGDIDEFEEYIVILSEADVKLKPFVAKVQSFLKKYQMYELNEWLDGISANNG